MNTTILKFYTGFLKQISESEKENRYLNKCTLLFHALESFSRHVAQSHGNETRNSTGMIREVVLKLVPWEEKVKFVASDHVKKIISFEPLIMNNEILGIHLYDPSNTPEVIREDASEKHHLLIESYNHPHRNNDIFLEKLVNLLYMVRSNIAHGGKPPLDGPDQRGMRDEAVCEAIYPALYNLLNLVLGNPEHRLLVYGTLMQNEPNSYLLNELNTVPVKVKIWGKVDRTREYPYYRYFVNTDAKNGQLHDEIVAELYESPFLPQIIHKLDLFEGPTYKRIRIPFEHNGTIKIGFVYADAESGHSGAF
jgi:gamma-glutamylcyclotransferase (GGCT)/AIG2-like uncharacterized protein YtfP